MSEGGTLPPIIPLQSYGHAGRSADPASTAHAQNSGEKTLPPIILLQSYGHTRGLADPAPSAHAQNSGEEAPQERIIHVPTFFFID